jgi:hypothetical protein
MTQRTWHPAPARETLTRVSGRELTRLYEGLPRALERLPLEVYVDAADTYWFGIQGEGFAEHHRWLWAAEPGKPEAGPFGLREIEINGVPVEKIPRRYTYSDVVQCGSVLRVPNRNGLRSHHGFKNLTDEIYSLAGEIEGELEDDADYETLTELDQLDLKRKALVIYKSLGYTGIYALRDFGSLTWDQDLHDLLHHYDAWLANHPEAADMPRELVLRMYGLGAYVEGQAASDYDWLDSYDDEPLVPASQA